MRGVRKSKRVHARERLCVNALLGLGGVTFPHPVIWILSGTATLFDASLLTSEPLFGSGSFFASTETVVDRPAFGHLVNYGLSG